MDFERKQWQHRSKIEPGASREGRCEKTIRKERPNISWERLGSVFGRLGDCPGTSRGLSWEPRELAGSVPEHPAASRSAVGVPQIISEALWRPPDRFWLDCFSIWIRFGLDFG